MEKCLHNVSDLPADARSVVEAIIGHPLDSNDVLYIAASGLSPDEIDRLIDSESAAVRYDQDH